MKKIFKLLVNLLPTRVIQPESVIARLAEAGTLSRQIATSKKYQIGSLKVIGHVNNTDIQYICDMAGGGTKEKNNGNLTQLDLSEAMLSTTPLNTLSPYSFCNCKKLNTIILPKSIKNIEINAFYGCTKLTTITIPAENNHFCDIDGIVFNKEKNDLLIYPKGRIGAYTIPNNVSTLRTSIFQNCNKLTSIVIPHTVKKIMEEAFSECINLKEIHCQSLIPPECQSTSCFERVNRTSCTLYVPKGAYSNYWLARGWGKFINIKEDKS